MCNPGCPGSFSLEGKGQGEVVIPGRGRPASLLQGPQPALRGGLCWTGTGFVCLGVLVPERLEGEPLPGVCLAGRALSQELETSLPSLGLLDFPMAMRFLKLFLYLRQATHE